MTKCRLCASQTTEFLDLGRTPLPEEFRTKDDLKNPVVTYPLTLVKCSSCGHVQLGYQVPADIIYKKNYFYDYSVTKKGHAHWETLAKSLIEDYHLNTTNFVIDIGSNTGSFLLALKKFDIRILGVDPAELLAHIAQKSGITTVIDYFTPETAQKIYSKYGKADIMTCTNVFDHVENLDSFMQAVQILLKNDGALLIEMPYFANIIKSHTHIVYHQQIDYMMLQPLVPFFNKFNMELYDGQIIPMHGGSIRLKVIKKGYGKPTNRLRELLDKENDYFRSQNRILKAFENYIYTQREALIDFIAEKKGEGHICAIGASAKGITLLNYCGLGPESIDFISEKSSLKYGRFTPSGIPILDDAALIQKKPQYALVLAWNFIDEIIANLDEYRSLGGTFICPVPLPHTVK